jgi:hypothetical protein
MHIQTLKLNPKTTILEHKTKHLNCYHTKDANTIWIPTKTMQLM